MLRERSQLDPTEASNLTREQLLERARAANRTIPSDGYAFPINVIVEPTNRCNLACIMCPSPIQTRERGEMSMELWKRIVDEVVEVSPTTAIWPAIMGEGLVAGERFLEMLEYGCSRNARIIWNTNAVLLSGDALDRVARLPIEAICVGLDAATAETYARIRVRGDFRAAVANTEALLLKRHPATKITVQFIEQELNAHEVERFKGHWLARGAQVKVRPRLGWGDGVDSPELILGQDDRVGPCPWLMRTISIHWNGNAVQCDADWDQKHSVGSIATSTILALWSGELAERRQRHISGDFSFPLCQSCDDWQAGISETFDSSEPLGEPA